MERPSHINFRTSHSFSSRAVLLATAISLPLVILWALASSTVGEFIRDHGDMVLTQIDQAKRKPLPPPPLTKLEKLNQVDAVQPTIKYDTDDNTNRPIPTPPTPSHPQDQVSVQAIPDHAAVAISSTHTIPPYPALAQRVGAEGAVTLRLTVMADGTVGQADILNSSGRGDLDKSAQAWIVAHWTYKPALAKGQPIASQTTVTVTFHLNDH